MKSKGFTLIELLITIACISIILAMASTYYSRWVKRNMIDGQVRAMYSDLMNVRSQALFQKKARAVLVRGTSYTGYSSSTVIGNGVKATVLKAPVTPATLQINFDEHGIATFTPAATDAAICVQGNNYGSNDSIVVTATQIQVGKLAAGAGCSNANVTRN